MQALVGPYEYEIPEFAGVTCKLWKIDEVLFYVSLYFSRPVRHIL
jgi:hypothetical protein